MRIRLLAAVVGTSLVNLKKQNGPATHLTLLHKGRLYGAEIYASTRSQRHHCPSFEQGCQVRLDAFALARLNERVLTFLNLMGASGRKTRGERASPQLVSRY